MASSVPLSTTEYPLVSDPIFTSLYCAASCSCRVGAPLCAAAWVCTNAIPHKMATTGIVFSNFCHMTRILLSTLGPISFVHSETESAFRFIRPLDLDPAYCDPPPEEAASCLTSASVLSAAACCSFRVLAALESAAGAGTSPSCLPVSGALGSPPVPCFFDSSSMPPVICSRKWLCISCRSSSDTETCLPTAQLFFLLATTFTSTFLSASGVSETRLITSPSVNEHSTPSATTDSSLCTTKTRRLGSSAGNEPPLDACPPELSPDVFPLFPASAWSAANCAFTSSAS